MAMPAHLTLEGESQGNIEGSCEMQGREGTILIEAFNHEVRIPRDPQQPVERDRLPRILLRLRASSNDRTRPSEQSAFG